MKGKDDPPYRLSITWVRRENEHHHGKALRETLKSTLTSSAQRGQRSERIKDETKTISKAQSVVPQRAKGEKLKVHNSGLREVLRRFRLTQARAREIPPYAVFSDAVLDQLITDQPSNRQSFLAIKGLGPAKWANYGTLILEIIEEHC